MGRYRADAREGPGAGRSARAAGCVVDKSLRSSVRRESLGAGAGVASRLGAQGWEEEVVQALSDSGVLLILVFTALPVLYLLPTLVGAIRRVDGLALVFLVNLIGAPTGVGWVGAMIMAFGPRRLSPPPPPTAPWTPSAYRAAYWRDAR